MRVSERAYQLRKELFPDLEGYPVQVVEERIIRVLREVRKDAIADARDRIKGMHEFELGRLIEEEPE